MALADRVVNSFPSTERLSNVIGCHTVSWETDHLKCPWNTTTADPNSPCCLNSPAKIIAEIANETWQKAGAPRVFSIGSFFDPSRPNAKTTGWTMQTADGYYTPFFEETWVTPLTERVKRWFGEYKQLGGTVDVMLLDFESLDYLNAGRMGRQRNAHNESNFGREIVSLEQWPALRTELEQAGKPFGASFSDADMAEMATWQDNQTDFRAYVWDAVVVSLRTATALNTSVFEPLLHLFPDVVLSNYAHNYHASPAREDNKQTSNWGYRFNEERHSIAFGGAHVGTHASHSAYGGLAKQRNLSWWNMSENVAAISVSTPWWEISAPLTPFNQMLADVRTVRNAKAAAPFVGYHPYFCPKHSERRGYHDSGQDTIYGDSDIWQEHLFHVVLSAATRQIATWNFEFSASANMLLSACLDELDQVVDQNPAPIVSGKSGPVVSFDQSFLLSGVVLPGGRIVHRVTFRDPNVKPLSPTGAARFAATTAKQIAQGKSGFIHEPVVGGVLVHPSAHCSDRGYWIQLD
jgi:hypothetical protein